MLRVKTYTVAQNFLNDIQSDLEQHESANSLMLGLSGRLARNPEQFVSTPCLKTVVDGKDLVLAVLMTPPYKLILYHHQGDMQGAVSLLVGELVREAWHVSGVLGPGEAPKRFAERWEEKTGKRSRPGIRQGVYELREVLVPLAERGRLRPAGMEDSDLVTRWWLAFYEEVFGEADPDLATRSVLVGIEDGDIYFWEDEALEPEGPVPGGPVSMARKTRPTRNGISIGLVYTPPEMRRKGYATACVAELSRSLLTAGWQHCALFTDLSNPTSNHIYQEIGYRRVCDYEEFMFE